MTPSDIPYRQVRLSWIIFLSTALLFFALCLKGGFWGYIGEHPLKLPFGFFLNESQIVPGGRFILLFFLTWALCLLLIIVFPRNITIKRSFYLILFFSMLFRIALIPHEPSDDVNRYLWEGKLLLQGINPYVYAPDDIALNNIAADDPFHKSINHPDLPAAYPPLILYIFSLSAFISYGTLIIKVVMILFDMGTIVFILKLLEHRKLNLRWALLYAANPVILYSFSGHGHFDVIQNFFLTGSLLMYDRKSWLLMFLFAGFAVQSKYVAAVVIPFLINRRNCGYVVIAAIVIILPYLFLSDTQFSRFFYSLNRFGEEYAFNGSIHGLFRALSGNIQSATNICKVLLCIILFFGIKHFHPGLNSRYREDPISGAFFSIGAILMLMPTVHFWYISWIVPFLAMRPSKPWILLCFTIAFYFISNGYFYQTGVWTLPVWAQAAEWLPFYLLLMGEFYVLLKRMKFQTDWGPVRSVSVVVPAKNEAEKIQACIQAVKTDKSVNEVVVVDGGSSDETALIAERAGAKVIHYTAPPGKGGGRGGQIYAGIGVAKGDAVAIVHADVTASYPLFSDIVHVLQKNPTIVGGAVGGVFNDPDWRFRIIEFLNDFRALFPGISFGDQIQFFRRHPVAEKKMFPRIPIMEDVEFSIVLNTIGRQTFLFGNALISSRRWKNAGFRNAFSVIRRLSLFLLLRCRGLPDTVSMYGSYYGKHLDGNMGGGTACKKSKNTLSIIIPVLNETALIKEIMNHLRMLSFAGDTEIIVVDGNPGGNTIKSLEESGRGKVNVKSILSAEGRGVQMNSGASAAGGDVLLFLHVDTFIGQKTLEKINTVFDQYDVIGGAFDFRINSERKIFRIIEKTASLRSRITRIPYGDQAVFIKKDYFNQIGGFSPIPIMEDVELMIRIKKRGDKIKILSDTVQTSSRRWEEEGILFCTLRNWMLIILYYLGVSPEKLSRFYQAGRDRHDL